MSTPPRAEAMARTGEGTDSGRAALAAPMPWDDAAQRLTRGAWSWLSTVRPDGSPHVAPLFAVWDGSVVFVSAKDSSRKARNLAHDQRCVVATEAGDLHLVVEGVAAHVTDPDGLARASAAFRAAYDWPTTPVDGRLDAEYGAPTSGGPPYEVYAITPTVAFGLPTAEGFEPTRWTF